MLWLSRMESTAIDPAGSECFEEGEVSTFLEIIAFVVLLIRWLVPSLPSEDFEASLADDKAQPQGSSYTEDGFKESRN